MKKNIRLIVITLLLLLTYNLVYSQQLDGGASIFEKAYEEATAWKEWIEKILYVASFIVLSVGVVKIVIKILTKQEGERVEIGGEIGRWLMVAAFIAAAGVITSLFTA
ncbi:hypothetical protein [Butyricimonas virosa]|jgi:hypothetical protein